MDVLKNIIRTEGKYVNVFIGKETTKNSLTGDVTVTYSANNPIKGLLEDMSDASAVYKIPGVATTKSKIFVCHKSNRGIIEASHKIVIDEETYYGYKDGAGSKIRIKCEGNYIRVYLTRKLFL